jgi:hypothetical protein
MGQLRPSAVANLKPVVGEGHPGLGKYYSKYELDFAPDGSRQIARELVEDADKLNTRVNDSLQRMVEAANGLSKKTRFTFVGLDGVAARDFKHSGDEKDRIRVTSADLKTLGDKVVHLDNRVLQFSRREEYLTDGTFAGQHISEGGFFSIDNLHPTVIGYSLLANALLDSIVQTEGITLAAGARESISPQAMYARYHAPNGSVLRRQDKSMASREAWYQAAFDLQNSLRGKAGTGSDCWPRQPKEKQ